MPAEPVEHVDQVRGEADADGHVADRVFQDQVPADDPGDQLAHGGVGVGVGAAGDGNHRGQFGVAQRGEGADDGHQHERKRQRRAGAGTSAGRRVLDEVVEQRGVQDGGGVELLSGDGCADDGEDAGADDGTDAQSGERTTGRASFSADAPVLRDSVISLSMDLQQNSWFSEVRMTVLGSWPLGCGKGSLSPRGRFGAGRGPPLND